MPKKHCKTTRLIDCDANAHQGKKIPYNCACPDAASLLFFSPFARFLCAASAAVAIAAAAAADSAALLAAGAVVAFDGAAVAVVGMSRILRSSMKMIFAPVPPELVCNAYRVRQKFDSKVA